jgi:hypothetical protein
MRWGMATSFVSNGVSTLHRLVFFVPSESIPKIDAILGRLKQ